MCKYMHYLMSDSHFAEIIYQITFVSSLVPKNTHSCSKNFPRNSNVCLGFYDENK